MGGRSPERLGEIALQLTRPHDDFAVLGRQLLYAQHRNNILQFMIARQVLPYPFRDVVVARPQGVAVHQFAARLQGSHRGIDTFAGLCTGQDHGGIQVAQDGADRRIRHVIRRDVDGLYRGDSTLLGRQDPVLHFRHLGREGGLVTYGGRHASKQAGNLAARLHETEDVVDNE